MASLPILTVLEQSQILPPPATVGDRSLPLTFFDFAWLLFPPVHHLFFYESPITKTQFLETTIPDLKHSLSITLQHFFPFAGQLIVSPSTATQPEIRHTDGDSVAVTFAESTLDFNHLVANHPRDCGLFYPLIPPLGRTDKISDYFTVPVFSVQVTLFPATGVSIGMTNHHSLGDASTRFLFLKAWTSITRFQSDKSFLANEIYPVYDRLIKYPKLDESVLKQSNLETLNGDYQIQPPSLTGPTENLRVTVVLTRTTIELLKKRVAARLPELEYISSFTASCGYIWSCIAKSRNDELQLFGFAVDCRPRMSPAVSPAYFGNCVSPCFAVAKTRVLMENEGFVTAAKLLGENLHKILNDKDGIVNDSRPFFDFSFEKMPTTMIGVAGTPRLRFYDLDFGWGRPRKHETISIDYNGSISLSACKESNGDLEIGVCLPGREMEVFLSAFNGGLKEFM